MGTQTGKQNANRIAISNHNAINAANFARLGSDS
jgi:hypothetical protein